MSKINVGGVVMGGLLAGLVINIIDFVVNVPVLGARWGETTKVLGVDPRKVGTTSAIGWIASDFLLGIMLVWLYAGIRPRFGPGPRTALIASVAVWFVARVAYASYVFMGLYPAELICMSMIGALVASLAGGQAGCWVYKEA
jgi:hypothetical protein